MSSTIFTFVRHAESTDNLKQVWAGWKESPLSNHGMNQAKALAASFAAEPFTAILTSPLNRALSTASAVHERQAPPRPPLIQNDLLKEQNFGEGEGTSYLPSKRASVASPQLASAPSPQRASVSSAQRASVSSPKEHHSALRNDDESRFPGGESRKEVQQRAEQVVEELLLPYAGLDGDRNDTPTKDHTSDGPPTHVLVVSHGIFIRHLVACLLKRGTVSRAATERISLHNTGWVRVRVEREDVGRKGRCVNRHDHLSGLVRQKGGIGSSAYDPRQKDLRSFFAGNKKRPSSSSQKPRRK
ncbi:histidine phosphatase superfamily [Schizophyllum amplum]|uniref:Histidine phosphatase superfamily n=1 Tax=Schizophyllum amplum TaxID=97359 RepID=A0A550CHC6_9AGAR|nr:histidine phosphatase superfamily [Auriculariopsis ampla]